ncbi:MAG: hypothetical protein AVDCRST_MAG70-548, partial [uncultured Thermomicrobiales bacterium]
CPWPARSSSSPWLAVTVATMAHDLLACPVDCSGPGGSVGRDYELTFIVGASVPSRAMRSAR